MYKVSLWVPTKGWKTISHTPVAKEAQSTAMSLLPLEVKVVKTDENSPSYTWFGGYAHNRNFQDTKSLQTLGEIE